MNLRLHFADKGQKTEETAVQETSYYHRKSWVYKTDQSQQSRAPTKLRGAARRAGDAGHSRPRSS